MPDTGFSRIFDPMDNPTHSVEDELAALSRTLDAALERLRRLAEENASLRRGRDQLAGERAALVTRNEQARARVEAMIERLKSLENAG
jgi:cell division protein ZapB